MQQGTSFLAKLHGVLASLARTLTHAMRARMLARPPRTRGPRAPAPHAHAGALSAPPHPCLPTRDPPARAIAYAPGPNEKLDPRAAIAGRAVPGAAGTGGSGAKSGGSSGGAAVAASAGGEEGGAEGCWQGGMFDRGSWEESQASWARTVVGVAACVRTYGPARPALVPCASLAGGKWRGRTRVMWQASWVPHALGPLVHPTRCARLSPLSLWRKAVRLPLAPY